MYDWELIRNRGGEVFLPGSVSPTPGDLVRLRFRLRRAGGSLARKVGTPAWVRVVHCVPGPSYVGLLEDEIRAAELGIAPAAPILFEAEHVFDVAPSSRPDLDEIHRLCVASRRLGEQPIYATRAIRVLPSHSRDSGWRFLSDADDESDLRRSHRIAVYRVSWLVHLDPSLRSLLGAPTGSRFEREHPGEPWTALERDVVPSVPLTSC